MMKRDWPVLFWDYDLRATLEAQLQTVDEKVRQVSEQEFDRRTDDYLSATIASALVVSPLELDESAIAVSPRDAKVDVTHDPDRHFFGPGPHYVDGLEVTYHVPFQGEATLWKCKPNQFTTVIPRAFVEDRELRFPYDAANRDVQSTRTALDRDLTDIKRWMSWVNEQVEAYNAALEPRVRRAVLARRAEIAKTREDVAALGLPIRGEASSSPDAVPPADRAEVREEKRKQAGRQYDVALSFAGEDRSYVDAVAEYLAKHEVTVFYDRFEEVNLWGQDLAEHFGNVYSRDSHFVVMFVSRHYAEKAWPSHERRHALSRHLKGDEGRILPVRFDDTDVPGLPGTIAYMDARVLTPEKLAELIRQKLDSW